MSIISEKIQAANDKNEKALTVFLTAGYPNPDSFVELVLEVENAGADIIEIGLPFGDSLADGPVIQASYSKSLNHDVNLDKTFKYINEIKQKSDIPIVLMSSSNPILNFGIRQFSIKALESGINGVIIPDVPLEEYDDFFQNHFYKLDTVLLTTPTSSEKRIKEIDYKSSGFLYCVSVVGTTGVRKDFNENVLENLERTYRSITKNKMQIGFGISSAENVKLFSPYCDGVIVGSAIIKSLESDNEKYSNTLELVKKLKLACKY
ncbi:MAG: tryptophan synthase subunit alpha [Melioribacteraceae bacterium]|nr:tryptophan synthase subunit alpha [Melioribacteraceae bacterium]